ncbi:unnamed protein product [Agarophyton chilense]
MEAPNNQLPSHIEKMRSRVGVGFKKIHNPVGMYGARSFSPLGYDNSFNMDEFKNNFQIDVSFCDSDRVIFDLIHVDAPIANAIRRILLVEVPSVAVETVFVHSNSSIMHDEMLAHRLGLVPLRIDPRKLIVWNKGDDVTASNTVKFSLKVRCEMNKGVPRDDEAPPDVLYKGHKVYSGNMKYVSMPGQTFESIPTPVHDDIILAKMRPGQDIHIEMNATKNIGKEHAKWSPVSTASYRLLPEVTIAKEIRGELAQSLKSLCPADVFDIEDDRAFVARPRDCTMCRECIREKPFSDHVELTRKRDHFIFDVESTGVMPADEVVMEALNVLTGKCDVVLRGLELALKCNSGADSDTEMAHEDQVLQH